MKNIDNLLKKRVIILDGAAGTELQKKGLPQGMCPEIWCLENPEAICNVHSDYVRAGADIIYTCTFGANREKLSLYGSHNVKKINAKLASLARKAAGKNTLVAGDIGPTGKFVEPFGPLGFEDAVKIFKEQVQGLLEGGVDLFVIETMMDIQEARAALIAVKELTDRFTMVTMTYEKSGRTLNGTDPLTALITLQSLGADAVGCNCSLGPSMMTDLIKAMKPYATVPLVAKPNAGVPKLIKGQTLFDMQPEEFASYAKIFVAQGANMLGGCCGTTPKHIAVLRKKTLNLRGILPKRKSISAVSSARSNVILEGQRPLAVVGECINPTGKKTLQAELREEKLSFVRQLAKEQESKGADLLDVNVAALGVNETKCMRKVIDALSIASDLPLAIDSPRVETIEAALRLYPGRALINSISGEKSKCEKLLRVAAQYGAMFILLPLDQKNIPETFEKRKTIIERIFKRAQKFGFTKSDIIVDGLVMTIASHPKGCEETLKTIAWCAQDFQINSIIGLSNISFGMPKRQWINASFLAMAQSCGLTMAIANPLDSEIMNIKRGIDVLTGQDAHASCYLAHFGGVVTSSESTLRHMSPKEKIFNAILEGNKEDIQSAIDEALAAHINAEALIHEIMIPAINRVGDLFDKKKYFLPQLIASAETMKIGYAHLEPHIKKGDLSNAKKTVVIPATVKDDIHDIGKNIVALMLKNHGFSIIDLGKDVSAAKIIHEIKRHQAPIVGLSALMTTTMVNMKDVIEKARKENLDCRFVIGGAVVTKSYAQSLGAEYAHDGVEAVRVLKKLSE
ncbi:MAG: homocysteine S-methyltransferase family protein [Candidatus Omnitrophota bacterium]